jgi:hypothetical protein
MVSSGYGPQSNVGRGRVERKTFVLQTRVFFVTWSRSNIYDHLEFYRKLQGIVPEGTEIYGAQELHEDRSTPHYHVTFRFTEWTRWTDARRKLRVYHDDGSLDTDAINIAVPKREEDERSFLLRTQAYSVKDGNYRFFGERIKEIVAKCTKCSYEVVCGVKMYCEQCYSSGMSRLTVKVRFRLFCLW